MVQWEFQPNGTPTMITDLDHENPVYITNKGKVETITQIKPDTDTKQFKSLGVRTPATLSDTYETNMIFTKSHNFAKFLHACPLTKLEAWIAYRMFFIPSVTYSAVTLSLQPKVIKRIHSVYLPMLLSRMGY